MSKKKRRLSEINVTELSLVRRGAVGRPFLFTKAGDADGFEVDEAIGKALETPSEGEAEFLKSLQGGGVTDRGELTKLLAFRRLLKASESRPGFTYKGLTAALRAADATPTALIAADLIECEATGAQPVAKAETPPRPWSEITADAHWLAKSDRVKNDAHAVDDLDRRADAIRKRDYSLSKEQAFRKAVDENPDLAERAVRHQRRQLGIDVDADLDVAKSDAETQLDAKAEEIRKSDPSLTIEQARVRAYRENRDLYKEL
jgi:hypothetical protein